MKKILLISILLLVASCSSVQLGPKFTEVDSENNTDALVYIYRMKERLMRTPTLFIDDKEIGDMVHNSYRKFHLPNGKHKIKTEWAFDTGIGAMEKLFDFETGKKYYIQVSGSVVMEGGFFSGAAYVPVFNSNGSITEMHQNHALNDLKQCKIVVSE